MQLLEKKMNLINCDNYMYDENTVKKLAKELQCQFSGRL